MNNLPLTPEIVAITECIPQNLYIKCIFETYTPNNNNNNNNIYNDNNNNDN